MLKRNQRTHPLLLTTLGGLAATTLLAAPPAVHHWGTDILHFSDRTAMTNDGVISNATGSVQARQNAQGHANNQALDITVQNLSANTTFQLLALVDDDTNLTQIGELTTDAKGRATVSYRQTGSSNGHASLGHGRQALPAGADPVSHLREVAVGLTNQPVLEADLTTPDQLQYLIKRDIGSNNVSALLRIQATTKHTQFQLQALGLSANTDYWLVLNDGIVQTNTTDSKGRLNIKSALDIPAEILDLRSVALSDTSSNVVVSTTLP